MKLDRNFIIPMVIILSMSIIIILVKAAPALPFLLSIAMVIFPVLIIQQKANNDWGQMFIIGMLLTIIYMALMAGAIVLANDYEWLERILIWPGVIIRP